MKTTFLLIILLLTISPSYPPEIPQLQPTHIGETLDFNEAYINYYNSPKAFEACAKVYQKMQEENLSLWQLTEEEGDILKYCNETKGVWDTVSNGCSWYCGGGPMSVTASSTLAGQGTHTYEAQNAHDFSYQNAWVEGADGYGIGESLTYTFAPESPRITTIIVVNGYVKSQKAWVTNSRVKKLRVYYNNEPIADLNLRDVRAEQSFSFDPLGINERSDLHWLKQQAPWTLKFEILSVYKGTDYTDTVISEIYFDGVDVH